MGRIFIMENFYSITGAPLAGKTALVVALNGLGFKIASHSGCEVVANVTERYHAFFSGQEEFARKTFYMDFEKYLDHYGRYNTSIFFDGTIVDSGLMLMRCSRDYGERLRMFLENYRVNRKVFVAPPCRESVYANLSHDFGYSDVVRQYYELIDWYKFHNYRVLMLPKSDVDARIEFVLKNIDDK